MTDAIHIVFPIFPGVTQLDFTGPHQVFSRLPDARLTVASATAETIAADGIHFSNLAKLSDVAACDIICVPGGYGTTEAALDDAFMREVRRLAAGARYITSVCTGSIILGAAGFLQGKRAACHWAWRDLLPLFGAIPDEARVVKDGNIVTGGGVTAGIDLALTVVAEIAGKEMAQGIQLTLEYAPAPPFDSGRPETAPPEVLANVIRAREAMMVKRREEAAEAAQRLKSGRR
jgi:cyclohexyl-isocyanide hydratase